MGLFLLLGSSDVDIYMNFTDQSMNSMNEIYKYSLIFEGALMFRERGTLVN